MDLIFIYYFYTLLIIMCRNNITMLKSSCGYNPTIVHDFDTVKTNDKLKIGILNAFKGAFDLGVKYTKEMIVTVTTAEMVIMVDMGLSAFEKIVTKVNNIPELQPFGKYLFNLMDYKLKFFDADLKIIEYMGYEYLSRSYKNYTDAIELANKNGTTENREEQFDKFLKTIAPSIPLSSITSPVSMKNTNDNQQQQQHQKPTATTNKPNKKHKGGGNNQDNDALKIADRIIDQIMLLPLHLQLDELKKIVYKLRNIAETKKMTGGANAQIKKSIKNKRNKGRRHIKKTRRMIYKSINSFVK